VQRGSIRELVPGINVFQKSDNCRIPDLTFVASGREQISASTASAAAGLTP
jgi:hypothetical protein